MKIVRRIVLAIALLLPGAAMAQITSTADGGTGADNSINNAGAILAAASANGNFVASTLTEICKRDPAACTAALGYTSVLWYDAKCDGIVNDTAAIQATFDSVGRAGGAVFIPATASGGYMSGYPATGGCKIELPANPIRANCALVIKRPIHLFGQGHGSLIKTPSTMASTTDNICMDVSDMNWELAKFENFAIGEEGEYHPPTSVSFRRYGKRALAFLINVQPSGYQNVIVSNMLIGEGNDYSVWFEGQATARSIVRDSTIFGGVAFNNVADNNQLLNNHLGGFGNKGVYVDAPGAGLFTIAGGTLSAAAGIILHSGYNTLIDGVYIEAGTNQNPYGVMIWIKAAANNTTIVNNLVHTFTTPPVPHIANFGTNTVIANNTFGGNSRPAPPFAGQQAINNWGTISCGINRWETGPTRVFSIGTIRNAIGTVVTDCP